MERMGKDENEKQTFGTNLNTLGYGRPGLCMYDCMALTP